MDDLILSIFLTSILIDILLVCYVAFRSDSRFKVSDTEKCIVVGLFLVSLFVTMTTSFTLIWI